VVEGDLDLSGNVNLMSLPEGLVVRGDLNVKGCTQLEFLPKGLKVGGTLYISETPLNHNYDYDVLIKMVGLSGELNDVINY
jgi:hypothetical protein